MPNREVAGWVVAVVIGAALFANMAADRPFRISLIDTECEEAQKQYYDARDRTISYKDQIPAEEDKARDEAHDHADVCAQYRMAQAAERGLWSLFLTLLFTGFAAVWAWRAAVHTKRQADIAEDSYWHLQRAYVVADNITIEDSPAPLGGIEIVVRWENCGNTPTRHLRQHTNFCSTDGVELPDDFMFHDSGGASSSTLVIPPKSVRSSAKIYMKSSVFKDAALRKKRLWLWGWVEYDDIFEKSPRHRTEVCVEILVDKDGTCTNLGFHRHNGMDSDCPPERYRTIKGGLPNPALVKPGTDA